MAEYRDVLSRPKFRFSEDQVGEFLAQLEGEGIAISAGSLVFHLPDPEDEPFLEAALSAGADFLITGNKRHFPKRNYGGVRVVSPAEFLEQWAASRGHV
jgi:predicted nucleic acid-binding protein